MDASRLRGALLFFAFLSFTVVYILCLPSTVQIGDSGELAAAAYRLLVPHPPGFPLFIWLEAAFTHLVPFGTVFWRASLLSSLFSLGTLLFLWMSLGRSLMAVAFVAVFAFSRIFWRYSELPDVFAMAIFCAALQLWIYFCSDRRLLPLLFFLSLAVHPSLLFMAPLLLHSYWLLRRERLLYFSAAFGLVGFSALYGSLLWLHPQDLNSWGNLLSIRDVIKHFLRSDYGPWQLSSGQEHGSFAANLQFVFEQSIVAIYALVAVALVSARQGKSWPMRERVVLGSAGLYLLVFFSLANTGLEGYRSEILSRFVLLWQILLVFALGRSFKRGIAELSRFRQWVLGFLLLTAAGLAFAAQYRQNDFSRNTIVEDYALNFIRQIPVDAHAVALLDTDTRFFAVRYVQLILGEHPAVTLVSPATLIYPWYGEKLVAGAGLRFDFNRHRSRVALQEELIEPNLESFVFMTNLPFTASSAYRLSFLPLGRMLSANNKTDVHLRPRSDLYFRSDYEVLASDLKVYDPYRDIWSDYANQLVILAERELGDGRLDQARENLEAAVARVPWCWPAVAQICVILERQHPDRKESCRERAQGLREQYFNYF